MTSEKIDTLGRWGRPLAVATAIVFCISFLFPLVAGLAKNTAVFPRIWGTADVCLAFFLALLVFGLVRLTQGKVNPAAVDSTYRTYRFLIHGIFAMLVIFFLAGDRIVWANCLTGFAWRIWLLLYCLPEWITASRAS